MRGPQACLLPAQLLLLLVVMIVQDLQAMHASKLMRLRSALGW